MQYAYIDSISAGIIREKMEKVRESEVRSCTTVYAQFPMPEKRLQKYATFNGCQCVRSHAVSDG
jgi:hypothetical protein